MLLYLYRNSEELYHIITGYGLMHLGKAEFEVEVGGAICIPPGTAHCIGNADLRLLCCCTLPVCPR